MQQKHDEKISAQEVLADIKAAVNMVVALCQPAGTHGAKEWLMSIPARPESDPDIVIAKALGNAKLFVEQNHAGAGVAMIAAERKRQIEQEGWTPEHDNQHSHGELGRAAGNYARFACEPNIARDYQRKNGHIPDGWPWNYSWWKPSADNTPASRIRDLQKAGALIAAEIDRLQRSAKEQP